MNTKERNRLLTMLRDCLRDGRDVIRRYEQDMLAGAPPSDIEPLRVQMAELRFLEQALLLHQYFRH